MMPPTFQDFDVMARTLYGEARGEIYAGKIAVAHVVRNRARIADQYRLSNSRPHPLFGDGTLRAACQWPWQFSCWNKNDPMRPKLESARTAQLGECIEAAYAVIAGEAPDPTNGATHYYANTMPQPPKWAVGLTPCAVIGAHRFFNNVP